MDRDPPEAEGFGTEAAADGLNGVARVSPTAWGPIGVVAGAGTAMGARVT